MGNDNKENQGPKKRLSKKKIALILFSLAVLFLIFIRDDNSKISVRGINPPPTSLVENAVVHPLKLNFSSSVAKLSDVNKVITKGISITPQIAGKWRWRGDSSLQFLPDQDWPAGQKYSVSMEENLFPEHIKLKTYKYNFETAPFEISFAQNEFYQDPINPENKAIISTVTFSHPVNPEEFEKRVSLFRYDGTDGKNDKKIQDYTFSITYDNFKGKAFIKSEEMSLPQNDQNVKIAIEKGVTTTLGNAKSSKEISANIALPGKYNYFKIISVQPTLVRNEQYEPEQVLNIEVSNGVRSEILKENLTVYLLPKDSPPTKFDKKPKKNFNWSYPAEVTNEVLSSSQVLDLTSMKTILKYPKLHSFKFNAPQRRYLYFKINEGIESYGGYILANAFESIARIPDYPKELKISHEGALLSLSGKKQITVLSRGLKGLKFEIGRLLPGEINHLVSQTSGNFNTPEFKSYHISQDNITELFSDIRSLPSIGSQKAQYSSFNFSSYISKKSQGVFFFKVQGWDPIKNRPSYLSDNRLILITDLGIIVKNNSNGSKDIFVQSIKDGSPVSGATVSVLGKNGVPVTSVQTDSNGHINLPDLKSFTREKTPTVYIAQKGRDISFIPYDRRDRGLNYTRFDTGGVVGSGDTDSLNAYLFSDRGIYQPGDKVNIGIVVKHPDWKKNLEGIPLEISVIDVKEQEIKNEKLTLSRTAFEEFSFSTTENSPTGTYSINAYIVKDGRRRSLIGNTTIMVEEFIPDRMKISTRFSKNKKNGWVTPNNLNGTISLKNLYGTPAEGRTISTSIELSPSFPFFNNYRDYIFCDPLKIDKGFTDRFENKLTDANGEAEIKFDLARFDHSTFLLKFNAEGFEAGGGRSVNAQSSILVSPLEYIIGYKKDGDLGYINKGSDRNVNFIALNSDLKPTGVNHLEAHIIEQNHVSILTKQDSGVYKYQSQIEEIQCSTNPISISENGFNFNLPTETPGDFILKIVDAKGIELSTVKFSVVGHENLSRDLEKNAELQIKLNKNDFDPNETIDVFIKAPYTGAGLITIEKEKVYAYKWFKTNTTGSITKIKIPSELEGNGYVNVTFTRNINSKEIFMSPLSYAVAPFTISKSSKNIDVKIDAPSIVKPGDLLEIGYQSKKPGKAVIFAIDEGILQVAHYTTPDPIAYYFKKRALEVETLQILDLILPEISMQNISSAPGGGMKNEALGKNINPFKRKRTKPTTFWSGIVETSQSRGIVKYKIPDYFNGKLRIIAVAIGENTIGSTESKTTVRGDFVLSPNAPTFVAPGDRFDLTLNIANNVQGSGDNTPLTVSLETSKHLQILQEANQTIVVPEGKEGIVTYSISANERMGSGELKFNVSVGDKNASYTTHISVRPPVPYMTNIQSGYGKKLPEVEIKREMYDELRTLEAYASPAPLSLSKGLLHYLEEYPYGCTEQLVSKGFPVIALMDQPEFGYENNDKIKQYALSTIDIIRGRQNPDGGFRYWPVSEESSSFITTYAAHFLTESRENNIPVPETMLAGSIQYLKEISRSQPVSLEDARNNAYAIYILTRNGIITTNYIIPLSDYLKNNHGDDWKDDIIAVYLAATFKLLQKDDVADKLILEYKMGGERKKGRSYHYSTLISDSVYLDVLSRHFPEIAKTVTTDKMMGIINSVINNQNNTLSSAYTILGLSSYSRLTDNTAIQNIKILETNASGKKQALNTTNNRVIKGQFSQNAKKITFEKDQDLTLFYQVLESGFDKKVPESEIKKTLEVQHEYRNEFDEVIESASLGEELSVHIKIRSLEGQTLNNIAIVDLLPGGFEVVLDSIRSNSNQGNFVADYVDIREDRVVVFGPVDSKVKEFIYKIKATNKGEYTVPPAFSESMYDKEIQARSKASRFVVRERQ